MGTAHGSLARSCEYWVNGSSSCGKDVGKARYFIYTISQRDGHDTIPCPHYGRTSGHGFRAIEVLTEGGGCASPYESHTGQRAFNAKINTIRQQLQSLGSRARDNPLRPVNIGTREHRADPPAPSICVYRRSPTPSPERTPPTSPLARPGRADGICVACHQDGDHQRPLITAPCSCMMYMPCALTFVENHLVSQREPSGSGVVSCPNPAMHDSRREVFWPRILELVDVAIPV